MTITFTPDRMTWTMPEKQIEFDYELHPEADPRAIDFTARDDPNQPARTLKGIYDLQGDRLRLIYNQQGPDAQRPTEFTSEPDSPNENFLVLQRVNDEAKATDGSRPETPPNPGAERIGFEKLSLDADDLVSATGLNIYKFKAAVSQGQRFRLVLRELRDENAAPRVLQSFAFESDQQSPVILHVSFLPRGDNLSGVLLTERDAVYRVQCEGCRQSAGFVTVVSVPGADVGDRTLFVHSSAADAPPAGPNTVRLLTLAPNDPKTGLASVAGYPRGELVLEMLPDGPK
ncbi:MAG: TIGR03067 domain-containing protein [Planctomycetaceae bacterium]